MVVLTVEMVYYWLSCNCHACRVVNVTSCKAEYFEELNGECYFLSHVISVNKNNVLFDQRISTALENW